MHPWQWLFIFYKVTCVPVSHSQVCLDTFPLYIDVFSLKLVKVTDLFFLCSHGSFMHFKNVTSFCYCRSICLCLCVPVYLCVHLHMCTVSLYFYEELRSCSGRSINCYLKTALTKQLTFKVLISYFTSFLNCTRKNTCNFKVYYRNIIDSDGGLQRENKHITFHFALFYSQTVNEKSHVISVMDITLEKTRDEANNQVFSKFPANRVYRNRVN